MKLAVRPLVDTTDAWSWVAEPEGDEHPGQLADAASELQDEGERPLGRGASLTGRYSFAAACELGAVGAARVARAVVAIWEARRSIRWATRSA